MLFNSIFYIFFVTSIIIVQFLKKMVYHPVFRKRVEITGYALQYRNMLNINGIGYDVNIADSSNKPFYLYSNRSAMAMYAV